MKSTKKQKFESIKLKLKKFYYKHKPVDKRDAIRLIVLAIAIPVFLYSAGQLIYKLYRYVYEDKQMAGVVELKPEEDNPFLNIDELEPIKEDGYIVIEGNDSYLNKDGVLVEYEELRSRNNDLAGWMTFPGYPSKPINYPILFSGDNSFYLRRDFNKHSSNAGSLFFDGSNNPYHNNPLEIDRNYVIYGHAMRNKSMFGYLTDFWKYEESWDKTTIFMDLMNTRLEYEIISTFLCEPDYNYRQTRFNSDSEYLEYLNRMVDKSAYDFGIEVTDKDKIITLSTCYKSTRRTAIIARLVRQIVYKNTDGSNLSGKKPQVVLPTHLPHDVPVPKPKVTSEPSITPTDEPTKEPSPTISDTPSPTLPVTPVPTSKPEILLNLILNPGIEDEANIIWGTKSEQTLTKDNEDFKNGEYSGKIKNSTEEPSIVFQDVTDILNENGSGRYSAGAYLKNPEGILSSYNVKLELTLKKNPEPTEEPSPSMEPSPTDEPSSESMTLEEVNEPFKVIYTYSKPKEINDTNWALVGDTNLFLIDKDKDKDIISLEGYTLIEAVLIIFELESEGDGFNFDDCFFYKEGVYVTE